MTEEQELMEDQYRKIGDKIVGHLCRRSGFDAAFDVDADILDEILLDIGEFAYRESLKALELDNY